MTEINKPFINGNCSDLEISDFCICAGDYDDEQKVYKRFLVRERMGQGFGPYFFALRETVIASIRNGLTFEVFKDRILKPPQGGSRLYLVTVDGKDYLRKDQAKIPADF